MGPHILAFFVFRGETRKAGKQEPISLPFFSLLVLTDLSLGTVLRNTIPVYLYKVLCIGNLGILRVIQYAAFLQYLDISALI